MAARHSDVLISATSRQVAVEIERYLVQRMNGIGLGPADMASALVLDSQHTADLRKLVRRILGDTAMRYHGTAGSSEENT